MNSWSEILNSIFYVTENKCLFHTADLEERSAEEELGSEDDDRWQLQPQQQVENSKADAPGTYVRGGAARL